MTEGPLIAGYDALLSDLDGVVYAGDQPIPGATGALERLSGAGVLLAYITNNASRSSEQVASHLRELGAPASPDQVFGSARAGALLLARHVKPGSKVLVTGSKTLAEETAAQGFVPVRSAREAPSAVIQGFSPDLAWKDLEEASYAIAAGAFWIATNTDLTIPRARGIAPGNGSLVAAVQAATGAMPLVAGKPEAAIFTTAAEALGASRPLVVGDRLDTDIVGGNSAGMDTAAVLTGVDGVHEVLSAGAAERPRYLLATLDELYRPYPAVVRDGGGFRCGKSTARVQDGVLQLSGNQDEEDTWRAACAAWWNAHPDRENRVMPELVVRPSR